MSKHSKRNIRKAVRSKINKLHYWTMVITVIVMTVECVGLAHKTPCISLERTVLGLATCILIVVTAVLDMIIDIREDIKKDRAI